MALEDGRHRGDQVGKKRKGFGDAVDSRKQDERLPIIIPGDCDLPMHHDPLVCLQQN